MGKSTYGNLGAPRHHCRQDLLLIIIIKEDTFFRYHCILNNIGA